MNLYGTAGAGNVTGFLDPASILEGVLRGAYDPPYFPLPNEWRIGVQEAPISGNYRAIVGFADDGVLTLQIDPVRFRAARRDDFGIADRARGGTQYVYQALTLLHELGHIYGNFHGGFSVEVR